MSYPGARIVILCCFLVHLTWISTSYYVLQLSSNQILLLIACVQSFTYLCYPVFGWLADTCFTRYFIIRVSTVLVMVFALLGFVLAVTTIIVYYVHSLAIISGVTWYTFLLISIPLTIAIAAQFQLPVSYAR